MEATPFVSSLSGNIDSKPFSRFGNLPPPHRFLETLNKKISLAEINPLVLFGRNDEHLDSIERNSQVKVVARGDHLHLNGPRESVEHVSGLLGYVVESIRRNPRLSEEEVKSIIDQDQIDPGHYPPTAGTRRRRCYQDLQEDCSSTHSWTSPLSEGGRTPRRCFFDRPRGHRKTYLAVAAAVAALREKRVSRIVLARPAVEAGESLGFLPGALEEKVDPYLRPLYDSLQDLLEPERLSRFQSMKIVEVAPLAFMRGRTLNEAFIILDEAQNTTASQMKMFLTRMGAHSKAVITGDITQTDLPDSQPSGLVEARRILTCVNGLAFVHLTERDVVRNPLVQRIIKAYETHDENSDQNCR